MRAGCRVALKACAQPAGAAELDAERAGPAVALLAAAQARATAAAAAGRAYDRAAPPTGMAAHEHYDVALRAAVDAPLAQARASAARCRAEGRGALCVTWLRSRPCCAAPAAAREASAGCARRRCQGRCPQGAGDCWVKRAWQAVNAPPANQPDVAHVMMLRRRTAERLPVLHARMPAVGLEAKPVRPAVRVRRQAQRENDSVYFQAVPREPPPPPEPRRLAAAAAFALPAPGALVTEPGALAAFKAAPAGKAVRCLMAGFLVRSKSTRGKRRLQLDAPSFNMQPRALCAAASLRTVPRSPRPPPSVRRGTTHIGGACSWPSCRVRQCMAVSRRAGLRRSHAEGYRQP